MPRTRRVTAVAAGLVSAGLVSAALLSACRTSVVPSPSPPPAASATPTATRPRFELATYQYALQTKGKIRVAIRDGGFPPLTMPRAAGAKAAGFEPDLAREIARAVFGGGEDPDAHIEWVSVDDATRISALTTGQADITVAALPIDADTRRAVDQSDPYLTVGQRLLVRRTNDQLKETADLASGEQTVCALKGSAAEAELRVLTNDRARILPLTTLDFCVRALESGAADAIAGDEIALLGLVAKQPAVVKLVGKTFATAPLGIAMKKSVAGDRQGFRDFVNATLAAIVADRTWARIYAANVTPVSGETKQLPTD